jgi:hypothetical protein
VVEANLSYYIIVLAASLEAKRGASGLSNAHFSAADLAGESSLRALAVSGGNPYQDMCALPRRAFKGEGSAQPLSAFPHRV